MAKFDDEWPAGPLGERDREERNPHSTQQSCIKMLNWFALIFLVNAFLGTFTSLSSVIVDFRCKALKSLLSRGREVGGRRGGGDGVVVVLDRAGAL